MKDALLSIYVASSWRNTTQPEVVNRLRKLGFEVYDFREPVAGESGPEWKNWKPEAYHEALKQPEAYHEALKQPEAYHEALKHPIAVRGYNFDIAALRACDICVLVLPSGRSASWEFGYAMGQGKHGIVMMLDGAEPELMYQEAKIVASFAELGYVCDQLQAGHTADIGGRGWARPSARRALDDYVARAVTLLEQGMKADIREACGEDMWRTHQSYIGSSRRRAETV